MPSRPSASGLCDDHFPIGSCLHSRLTAPRIPRGRHSDGKRIVQPRSYTPLPLRGRGVYTLIPCTFCTCSICSSECKNSASQDKRVRQPLGRPIHELAHKQLTLPMSTLFKTAAVIAALLAAGALARWIVNPWFAPLQMRSMCSKSDFSHLTANRDSTQSLGECFETKAKLFMEKDYAESKDLAKTFLTLLSALLVTSITFSEKIVDIHNSKRTPLIAMISCWLLLLLAIIFTGSGLATMAVAAGIAAYSPQVNYSALERHAVQLFISGCFCFGFALLALIIAGIVSLLDKRSTIQKTGTVESAG